MAAEKEYRLALVLNGGVSLAVWMAGVIYEIDLLRRASDGGAGREDGAAEWSDVLAAGDGGHAGVVVDVIAGTSAGGLNGTLLAAAIARGASLDRPDAAADAALPGHQTPWLRDLWVELASLQPGRLLPKDDRVESILDGEYFRRSVRTSLPQQPGPAGGDEVTLFVTATMLDPSERRYRDAWQTPFTVADHRRLYRFRRAEVIEFRPPSAGGTWDDGALDDYFAERPVNDFLPAGDADERLATAARASASFPVAFAPVDESPTLHGEPPRVLPRGPAAGHWLADGGVLDNAPFLPVLDAVTRRPLDGPVERVLVYIVPSNGQARVQPAAPAQSAAPPEGFVGSPSWMRVAEASIAFPREIDFRGQIEQIETLVRASDAVDTDNQRLFVDLLNDAQRRARHVAAARTLLPAYRRSRVAGAVVDARSAAASLSTVGINLTPTTYPAPEDVDTILAQQPGPCWVPACDGEPGQSLPGIRPWEWGVAAAERAVRLMVHNLRVGLAAGGRASGPADSLGKAVSAVDLQLRRILAIRDRLDSALATAAGDASATAPQVAAAIDAALRDLHLPSALGAAVNLAAEAFAASAGGPGVSGDVSAVIDAALAVEVTAYALSSRVSGRQNPPFKLLRIGPDARVPVLGEPAGGASAQQLGVRKLYGVQVGHFGAFGRPEWRRWDWLCGRLDAVSQLAEVFAADDAWVRRRQEAVLTEEGRTVAELDTHLAQMRVLTGAALFEQLAHDPAGNDSLVGLGDRIVTLLGARVPEKLSAIGISLQRVLQRRPPANLAWWRRVPRWLAAPARNGAWRLLSPSVELPGEPAPWPLRWGLHTTGLVVLIGATVAGLWLHITALAIAGAILAGMAAILLAEVVAVIAARRWLAGKILRGRHLTVPPGRPWTPTASRVDGGLTPGRAPMTDAGQ